MKIRIILTHHIYATFFEKYAQTEKQKMRYFMYAHLLFRWSTSNLTDRELLAEDDFNPLVSKPFSLIRIRRMAKRENPKMFRELLRSREIYVKRKKVL